MIWLHRFTEELGKKQENSRLYCDNEIFIHLEMKSSFHLNTKHIQLRYHFIRSILEDGHLKLEKIHTSQNLVDMLTKGVTEFLLSFIWPSILKVNMINFPGPRWSIFQQVQQQWSYCDQYPCGRLLVVEPDYIPDLEVYFSCSWTPFPNGGGLGGFPPPPNNCC
jgi:hypothetical protein